MAKKRHSKKQHRVIREHSTILELKVLTLNINTGHNLDLMKQCKVLEEYSLYVDRIRTYVPDMGLDAAVHRAVEECIKENILADFLRQNRAEVEKVSIFEYDKEDEERKLRIAEYEHGREVGIAEGERRGERRGLREGEKRGLRKGRQEGKAWMNLLAKLMEDNRFDDVQKAIVDETYRNQLMGEYR